MSNLLYNLIPFVLLAILLVLFLGLINLMRGGNPKRSQSLMRARVILQAAALVIIVAAVYLMKSQ